MERTPPAGLYQDIERYYTRKILTHGPTPAGVDWPCMPTQELRFVQLLKLCDTSAPFSLNDLGCGYGALLALLARRYRGCRIDYLGVDLSAAMIDQARQLWAGRARTQFSVGSQPARQADYTLASGIFNVKLAQPRRQWARFVRATLGQMRMASRRGFAVNFLAPPPRGSPDVPELYRVAPGVWRRHCEQAFGAQVTVLKDYGMREYTLLVRLPVSSTVDRPAPD